MVKVYKKLLTLLATGSLVLASPPNANAEIHVEGDKIRVFEENKVYRSTKLNGFAICKIPKDSIVHRILSYDNGWNLVRYTNQIGYIYNKTFQDLTDENVYSNLTFTETDKILQVKEKTYLKLDPFEEAKSISMILPNEKLNVIAQISNGWYLVNSNGTKGFANGKNLKEVDVEYYDYITPNSKVNIRSNPSTESNIINILQKNDCLPYIEDYDDEWYKVDYNGTDAYVVKSATRHLSKLPIDYLQIIYVEKETPLLENSDDYSIIVDYLEKGQTGEVISEDGDYYLINTFDKMGFVKKNNVKKLSELNVVIDISSKKLALYDDNNILVKANVLLGEKLSPTPLGELKIEQKNENYLLNNNDNKIYAQELYNGPTRDSYYEKEMIEDENIYMDKIAFEKTYKLTKAGTPIIIHK